MTGSGGNARWWGLVAPAVATLAAFSILVGLGVWQLERKRWKEGLLEQIRTRAHADAAPLPAAHDWAGLRQTSDEYRRVRLAGRFDHGREVAIHGLAELSPGRAVPGFYVFTPFRLAEGGTVVVNRGFVPADRRDPAARGAARTEGATAVTGLLRWPEERGSFVPANEPAREEWFVRNLRDIAAARGLDRAAPFYVDADATANPGGWPKGGQTQLTLKNDHLQYAFTWFGLAASLLGVFGAFAWRRLHPADNLTVGPVQSVGHPQEPG